VATAREAVDGGFSLQDLMPRLGDGEADRVIGAAFGGRLPDGVRVTTKRRLGNPPARRWPTRQLPEAAPISNPDRAGPGPAEGQFPHPLPGPPFQIADVGFVGGVDRPPDLWYAQ
jgi:hypothetical protein